MAVYINESDTVITILITDCVYDKNYAYANGGGLYFSITQSRKVYDKVVINGTQFTSNVAGRKGGGLLVTFQMTITDCVISNNSAPAGGGIYEYDHSPHRKNKCVYQHCPSCTGPF